MPFIVRCILKVFFLPQEDPPRTEKRTASASTQNNYVSFVITYKSIIKSVLFKLSTTISFKKCYKVHLLELKTTIFFEDLFLPHSAQLGTQLWLSSSLQVNLQVGPQSGIIIVRNRPAARPTDRPHQCLRSCISSSTDQILTKLQK